MASASHNVMPLASYDVMPIASHDVMPIASHNVIPYAPHDVRPSHNVTWCLAVISEAPNVNGDVINGVDVPDDVVP